MAETLTGIGVLTYFPFDSLNAVTMTCRATSTGRTEVVIDPLTGDAMDRFTIPRENVILWEPCECPNCDDPTDNLACRKDFCAECSRELGYEAVWPDYCERCALRVDGGR